VGDNGGRGALSMTDATLNVSGRLVAARMPGSYAEINMTRSSLINTTHGSDHLHICEGGSSTGVVTLTDSLISYTRSAGTANRGILFANDPNGVCAVTNINSVIELITTNGTYMQMAGGANSRVIYHQQGAGARLTSQAEMVIGYGAGSVAEFRQLDGAVESAGALRLAENAGATVDYWLSGGTLSPQRLLGGSGTNGRLHFDGGTCLVPAARVRWPSPATCSSCSPQAGRRVSTPQAKTSPSSSSMRLKQRRAHQNWVPARCASPARTPAPRSSRPARSRSLTRRPLPITPSRQARRCASKA
jgi:hypothetical protein